MMDRLVSDPIPNIRFNVAKSYKVIIDTLRQLPEKGSLSQNETTKASPSPKGAQLIQSQIMPNLEKLQRDDDVDVRYYATVAAGGKAEGGALFEKREGDRMDTGN